MLLLLFAVFLVVRYLLCVVMCCSSVADYYLMFVVGVVCRGLLSVVVDLGGLSLLFHCSLCVVGCL